MATDVSALVAAITQQTPAICQEAAEAMGRDVALSAPIGDTGDLSRDWDVATQPTGDGAVSTLTFRAPYASYVDEGTKPHEIRGNPFLAFEFGGQTVIVRSVQHPGTAPTNFFKDKAEDEGLWGQLCQAAADASPII